MRLSEGKLNEQKLPIAQDESPLCQLLFREGGGGGVLNKFLYGEAPPLGRPPYPLIYHFLAQSTPSAYRLLKNGDLLIHLVQHFVSILTAVNALFEVINKPRTGIFSGLFHSHEMHLLTLLSHFTDRNDRVPTPFIYTKPEKAFLSCGAYPHSHYREDPRVC